MFHFVIPFLSIRFSNQFHNVQDFPHIRPWYVSYLVFFKTSFKIFISSHLLIQLSFIEMLQNSISYIFPSLYEACYMYLPKIVLDLLWLYWLKLNRTFRIIPLFFVNIWCFNTVHHNICVGRYRYEFIGTITARVFLFISSRYCVFLLIDSYSIHHSFLFVIQGVSEKVLIHFYVS